MPFEPVRTVVVVHRGRSPYLESCLRRAALSAPGGRVVLIGDDANASLGIGEHHDAADASLSEDLDRFRAAYAHRSRSQTPAFERGCIERWFLVRNFMRRERLDGCLAIDSDVLLFCDVAAESTRFRSYAMTFARWDAVRVVPHCNFIHGIDALEDFCRYVLDVYRDPERLRRIADINRKKFNAAWVSDMSLFAAWAGGGDFPVGFLEDTVAAGVAFDTGLGDTRLFRPSGYLPGLLRQWKHIEFRDGVPYATLRGSGLAVPMRCLHYQGRIKVLMERHQRAEADDWAAAGLVLRHKFADYPRKFRAVVRNYVMPRLPTGRGPAGARRLAETMASGLSSGPGSEP